MIPRRDVIFISAEKRRMNIQRGAGGAGRCGPRGSSIIVTLILIAYCREAARGAKELRGNSPRLMLPWEMALIVNELRAARRPRTHARPGPYIFMYYDWWNNHTLRKIDTRPSFITHTTSTKLIHYLIFSRKLFYLTSKNNIFLYPLIKTYMYIYYINNMYG